MSIFKKDELESIKRLCSNIRILQADSALSADALSETIRNEIELLLHDFDRAKRGAVIKELRRHFPLLEDAPPVPQNNAPEMEAEDLLEEFLKKADSLSGVRRCSVMDRLKSAGFVEIPEAPTVVSEVSNESAIDEKISCEFGISSSVDKAALSDLFCEMLVKMNSLDGLTWNVWSSISPNSKFKKFKNAPTLKEQILSAISYKSASSESVGHDMDNMLVLISCILAGIGSLGKTFARKFADKYSPHAIYSAIRLEKGAFLKSDEAKCWNKYVQLFEDLNEMSMDAQIKGALSSYVDELVSQRKLKGK